jgi:hypothetical protein
MNMKIKYGNIEIKKECCIWKTNMNAYTDLSIEIERRGFYNNPEWFNKMEKKDFVKCIKLFKDFSRNIEGISGRYFLNMTDEAFVYDFCKESIRLFRECNDDLYVLCCNYMKALALCSNDFYNNIPDWLSTLETASHIVSSVSGVSSVVSDGTGVNGIVGATSYASIISALIANNNYEIGDDMRGGDLQGDDLQGDDLRDSDLRDSDLRDSDLRDSDLLNNNDVMNSASTINPSNNFLLYYYVEYM